MGPRSEQHPAFRLRTPVCLRSDADAPLGATCVPRHHNLLPLGRRTNGFLPAGVFLPVDWHGHLRPLVDPPQSQMPGTMPGARDFTPYDPQAYPFPAPAQKPQCSPSASTASFGLLPLTPRGNLYIRIFADRFNRRANIFAVTAAHFTPAGTADIFIDQIPCPLGVTCDGYLRQRPTVSLQAL